MRASGGVSSPCWVGRPVPRGSGLTRSLATCCGSETTGSAPGGPGHDDAARAAERRPQRSKSSSSTSTAPKTVHYTKEFLQECIVLNIDELPIKLAGGDVYDSTRLILGTDKRATITSSRPTGQSSGKSHQVQELAHMVFAKIEESAKRGRMGAVRGHELVYGIREGACSMELGEDGEPCVPPRYAVEESGSG